MKDFKNESNNFQQFQLNATQFSGRDACNQRLSTVNL